MHPRQEQLKRWQARFGKNLVWQWLIVAAAYYVAGRLALLLAIPPGYATAVWPSAGIALAAVLFSGRKVFPAIVAGSFLLNFWTSLAGANPMPVLRAAMLAAAI